MKECEIDVVFKLKTGRKPKTEGGVGFGGVEFGNAEFGGAVFGGAEFGGVGFGVFEEVDGNDVPKFAEKGEVCFGCDI